MTTQASTTTPTTPASSGTPNLDAPAASATAPAPAADAADVAGKQREIERLREMNRQLKAQQEEREKRDADAEAQRLAKNQEFEKLAATHKAAADEKDKELQKLRAQQDRVYIDAQLRARRHELLDPEDLALFDASALSVEAGEVKALDEKWEEFRKRKPHLFKPVGAAAAPPAKPNATHLGGPNPTTRGEMKKPTDFKTTEEWEAYVRSQRGA